MVLWWGVREAVWLPYVVQPLLSITFRLKPRDLTIPLDRQDVELFKTCYLADADREVFATSFLLVGVLEHVCS